MSVSLANITGSDKRALYDLVDHCNRRWNNTQHSNELELLDKNERVPRKLTETNMSILRINLYITFTILAPTGNFMQILYVTFYMKFTRVSCKGLPYIKPGPLFTKRWYVLLQVSKPRYSGLDFSNRS